VSLLQVLEQRLQSVVGRINWRRIHARGEGEGYKGDSPRRLLTHRHSRRKRSRFARSAVTGCKDGKTCRDGRGRGKSRVRDAQAPFDRTTQTNPELRPYADRDFVSLTAAESRDGRQSLSRRKSRGAIAPQCRPRRQSLPLMRENPRISCFLKGANTRKNLRRMFATNSRVLMKCSSGHIRSKLIIIGMLGLTHLVLSVQIQKLGHVPGREWKCVSASLVIGPARPV